MNTTLIRIFFAILLESTILPIFGQSTIYTESKIFVGTDYTYRCKKLGKFIKLYNDSNKYVDSGLRYKDSSRVTDMDILSGETQVVEEDTMMYHFSEIIAENFTPLQIQQFNNFSDNNLRNLSTSMFFNPDTGRIIEVKFSFDERSPLAEIPVNIYRNIELALKQRIRITFNDIGKSFLFATCRMELYKIHTPN